MARHGPFKTVTHLGSGFAFTWPGRVRIPDVDPSLAVVVDIELDVEDDRLVIERFDASRRPGGPPVTIDVLKGLPLVSMIRAAAGDGGMFSGLVKIRKTASGASRVAPADRSDLDELSEAEQAAVVYRTALFFGLAPTALVAEELGISRDMAAKRVQAARLAGLLEPTTKGKKGG